MSLRCLELFAGAGGAALGLERAGLAHAALCEWDRDACATLRAAGLGPVVEGDVRDLDTIAAAVGPAPVDVLWSSFPCQAWSIIGERIGARDERNGWPWTMAAVDRFRPAWFLGENVRGLLIHREGCAAAGGQQGLFGLAPAEDCPGCYLERVIIPDLRRRFAFAGWWLLNAADFGVPQRRYRVILWAGPAPLTAPVPTHGPGRARPWVTMREALGVETRSFGTDPSEADTVYARRVRNLSDQPSPTVGAMYRGWLGGQPWAQLPDGQRRILTVEECALLQGFPAGHPWQGQSRPQYRQVGNAVPPRLAEVVGAALLEAAR